MRQLRLFTLTVLVVISPIRAGAAQFRAGAHQVDISPPVFPVRVNAMFTERSASQVVDPLWVKAIALDDGTKRLVLCVVDSCMLPRDLIDRAKAEASRGTSVPMDQMLVSATHTHSAPAAMGCLGSRVDPEYAAWLPARIAAAIQGAVERLEPARIGWGQRDDWEHTFNRRWIRRPDRMLTDPFGERSVRAHMHPGYESPDAVGPSGPVDPQISVLALQHLDGRPMALLANYSMHYYGSPLLSSDYFGRFARHVATSLGADDRFVGIMSQGTSGDLMWMDYSAPSRDVGYDAYAHAIAATAAELVKTMAWHETAPLRMAERKLSLKYRVPDEKRLMWARQIAAGLGGPLPKTHPEIYALEALYLRERPETELIVQALRIGDLGMTALPNEVYALTGLKLKRSSPLAATFNIELANGAEGYIPPPEQHDLGGYTTWPARTAGLEIEAEPRLVDAALALLEQIAERPRRAPAMEHGPYAHAVLGAHPLAYWRLEEMGPPQLQNAAGERFHATVEPGVAFFLPGADARQGFHPPQPPVNNAFSGSQINRAVHFAGGRLRARLPFSDRYSVELWLWNGLPPEARAVTGYFFSRKAALGAAVPGEALGLGGTARADALGKLIVAAGDDPGAWLVGRSLLAPRRWHHVVLVREGSAIRVHLNGRLEPDMAGEVAFSRPVSEQDIFLGGCPDGAFGWEGKLDEVAIYPRPLAPGEIAAHYGAAGLGD